MEITKKAYAKINLGLDVLGKRDDGYHLVKMIMQNVDIFDTLTFRDTEDGSITLSANDENIPVDDSNLICKVARQLKEAYGVTKGAQIELVKRIPVAAGMAGGSTDGAAAYKALNELWNLGLSDEELCKLAVKLGADIPYCIVGGTALSEGIGEVLTPIDSRADYHLVVAKPDIMVSTGWVYTELDSTEISRHPDIDAVKRALEEGDVQGMCDNIHNVLEPVTTAKYDVIKDIEKILEENGAVKAFMTGSGPTVFAVFDDEKKAGVGFDAVKKSGLAWQLFLTKPIDPGRV
ncbi:4-(cytidine 5'-diphospho)-2-C-methyl-D-erythritol kinase [Butyrivibrio sp. CB08]|uniref:4-(cytidine 5'-diphospho)-2-C-methyl-D-erythritol kinase n=1 Tax=Butyrivibrio sp. CB08 TaxID=2364879 RepID=UPI000EA9FCA8|nr:4-(cytidine 5'-diphospho)-2-C-methyl-D-erythritol kinase [Butyrivibrio sp. CB08]RKM55975.1 4-(cytidine 5'-diphospho)-2-C-methyl-D-erythritol kinase [Butyrivibrio sp. CB08]